MKRCVALVDCNNFYASCERLFNPSLKNRPVIVLSNNDGCIVARSEEAKEIGLPFASPYFKVKPLAERHGTAVFSSNYTLYADISRRVMSVLSRFSPDMEVYSIDEAFLSFEGMNFDLREYGRLIRETVYRWVGIPVSVGIAPTKTLAKCANYLAKKDRSSGGVFDLSMDERGDVLRKVDIGSIWGVGPAYAAKLRERGVYNAADFITLDEKWVRSNMTIMGLRTLLELKGRPCISLEDSPPPKKGIVTSKSFGKLTGSLADLEQAVSLYASRCAEKLRGERGFASVVTVFIMTDRFKDMPQYADSLSVSLPEATANTPVITGYSLELLRRLYREGYKYKKCGVMLSGIVRGNDLQMNLFLDSRFRGKPELMKAIDSLNSTYGSGTLFYASSGVEKPWSMSRKLLSPAYTTRWSDIPEIRI
ncbi:MAG TPA: Y-family DNA polymerase [Spirochaetota bacterium]|nr:Y-family DNA polymerase [Spirochaetota bacterium]HPJ34887.1 Y-family DNA polymerase [Spirochaetota bacterium]